MTFVKSGSYLIVRANVDGDTTPEIEIAVDIVGKGGLHGSDFIL